ncbi:MAG TPA: lauroyl acyltransferase, partial [Sulfitobacter pontiacus]|nr:lauroyl acyltransferase [Sulfitobacter pontiacus]
ENYSARDFPKRMAKNTPTGAGVAALEKAAEQGKPVILVTGHYGNYEAMRA